MFTIVPIVELYCKIVFFFEVQILNFQVNIMGKCYITKGYFINLKYTIVYVYANVI